MPGLKLLLAAKFTEIGEIPGGGWVNGALAGGEQVQRVGHGLTSNEW